MAKCDLEEAEILAESDQVGSDQDLGELDQKAMTSHDRRGILQSQPNVATNVPTTSRFENKVPLDSGSSLRPVVHCGPAAQDCRPVDSCGPVIAGEPPHIYSKPNNIKITTDDLAEMFVRCREMTAPSAEDK